MINLVEYMKAKHTGKVNQISYGRLYKHFQDLLPDIYSKDGLRAHMNKLFEQEEETLVSTAKGVYVSSNKEEVNECADRLIRHGISEIVRGYKMKKLPLDNQIKLLLEEVK